MPGVVSPANFTNGALVTDAISSPSVLSSGKLFTAAGALLTTLSATTVTLVNGLPLAPSGFVFTVAKGTEVAPVVIRSGLKFDASGALVTVTAGLATAPLFPSNGVTIDASGALVIA